MIFALRRLALGVKSRRIAAVLHRHVASRGTALPKA
jgi:hypothetical protein